MGSLVSILTRLRVGQPGFDSWQGIISLTTEPHHPLIHRLLRVVFLGVNWMRREADYSPPSSAKVMNAWSYTSSPLYVFMAWYLIKAQGRLYLYILP